MRTTKFKIISWNLNGRVKCIEDQLGALKWRRPDFVAVQEVTTNTLDKLKTGFAKMGLEHCADSLHSAARLRKLTGRRKYGVLVASVWPLSVLPSSEFPIRWPERLLSVIAKTPMCKMEVHTTYIPPGATNGWTKILILEEIFEALSRASRHPRILCGDFNVPWEELMNGEIITCGQRKLPDGSWVVKNGVWRDPYDVVDAERRWDLAERNIMEGWPEGGLRDMYRAIHVRIGRPYKPDKSWLTKRGRKTFERRFDHIFACSKLDPVDCRYLHRFREQRLSDHAAVEAVLRFRTAG